MTIAPCVTEIDASLSSTLDSWELLEPFHAGVSVTLSVSCQVSQIRAADKYD